MIERKRHLIKDLDRKLQSAESSIRLPGIRRDAARACLLRQLADSIGRVDYFRLLTSREMVMSSRYLSPANFNPIKTAIWEAQRDNLDEACWLLFLATHFGMNRRTRWQLVWAVYTHIGGRKVWSWKEVSHDVSRFTAWLQNHSEELRLNGPFGNHRKYESLHAPNGTALAIRSYSDWVLEAGDHVTLFAHTGGLEASPSERFDALYQAMNRVARFGRTAKFDYLTMLGKAGIADIEPGVAYLNGSTGPVMGARLLFSGRRDSPLRAVDLEERLALLAKHLPFPFAMQVLEDALCNWQKEPTDYRYFAG